MLKLIFVLCLLSVTACASTAGKLNDEGYANGRYDYKVTPEPSNAPAVMGGQWKLDNFYREGGDKWFPKIGPDYRTTYALDLDGDGEFETSAKGDVYDLRFTHLGHDGVVFLRTIPISTDQGGKRLDVLVDRYVQGIAGAGYSVVTFGGRTKVVEKRYAATIVQEGPAEIAGMAAHAAIVDIKNIDQVEVQSDTKGDRLLVVIAHTGFKYLRTKDERDGNFPVLLIAGYWNRADEFQESVGEFQDFLNRITIGWHSGAKISFPASEEVAESAAANQQEAAALEATSEPSSARAVDPAPSSKSPSSEPPSSEPPLPTDH